MKKKRLTTVLGVVLALFVVAGLIGIMIHNNKSSGPSDFVIEDGVLTKYTGDAAYVSIPKDVRSIASFVFYNHTEIERVKMADTVTNIGQGAFYGCTNLKNLSLSKGLTYIDDGAFGECDSLESFEIPASVQFIIEGAFYGSDSIMQFTVSPDNAAFTSVDGVLYTKDMSIILAYPAGRVETEYTVSDSVSYIAAWAFHCAENLQNVTLPASVAKIGEEAFYASGLTQLSLPAALTELGTGVFFECTALTQLEIPQGVTVIPTRALSGCTALQSVTLPEGLTEISQMAFSDCPALETVNIPSSLTDISENSFQGCANLTLVCGEGSFIVDFAEAMGIAYTIQE